MPTAVKSSAKNPVESAPFEGFEQADFDIFDVPGFAARMPLLRAQIKPKLASIGGILVEPFSKTLDEQMFPHVAQHLRRTVNAPVETWVAFSRSPRAYKPFVHIRVAASLEKMRVTVFVEDYAVDKLLFATNLFKNAPSLSKYFRIHPEILAYSIENRLGSASFGTQVTSRKLKEFAERMQRVKGQHAIFGIQFPREHSLVASPSEFPVAAILAVETLKPLYDCGRVGFRFKFPE